MTISERIRTAIEAKGISLKDASEVCGIPYGSLQNWVGGLREPRIDALAALSTGLGISLDWLINGYGEMFRAEHPKPPIDDLSPRQQAVLGLFNALPDEKQREILSALEDKKRMIDMEAEFKELKSVLAALKSAG